MSDDRFRPPARILDSVRARRGGVARARVEALPARDTDRQPGNHDDARGGDRARASDCRATRARARGRAPRRRVRPGRHHAKLCRAGRRRQAGVCQAGRGPRLFTLLVGRTPVQARRRRRSDHHLQARRIGQRIRAPVGGDLRPRRANDGAFAGSGARACPRTRRGRVGRRFRPVSPARPIAADAAVRPGGPPLRLRARRDARRGPDPARARRYRATS